MLTVAGTNTNRHTHSGWTNYRGPVMISQVNPIAKETTEVRRMIFTLSESAGSNIS